MKKHITFALLFAAALTAQAQQGGISGEMLNQIKQSYKATPADKAIRNALGGTSINTLALNQENRADFDTEFSHKVLSKGITDQQSSGRCLFTSCCSSHAFKRKISGIILGRIFRHIGE